jgi:MoxR-like ATPase
MKQTKSAQSIDLARVASIGDKLQTLSTQVISIFPEREDLVHQILNAILTREHVMVTGVFGTGKSDLINTIFECFTGARRFSVALTKFMTESHVIGTPDIKRMRQKGEIHYSRDGGILEADFAEFDEFLDANSPLLRVLLQILNERQFKRGRQIEGANLHTAIACTNGDPAEEVKKDAKLGAVIDRFMFQCNVSYLTETDSRLRMYEKYLAGKIPSIKIDFEELKYVSGIVVSANQIGSPLIIQTFDQIVESFCKETRQVLSDRRKCKLLQLVEASALMFGRYEVTFEDLDNVKYGICRGHEHEFRQIFDKVAKPIIEKAVQMQQQSIDEVQLRLLQELRAQVPAPQPSYTKEELVDLVRVLNNFKKKIEDVRPQLASTLKERDELRKYIDERLETTLDMITKG